MATSPIHAPGPPDWSREERAPGEWKPSTNLLHALRAYQRHRDRKGILSMLLRPLAVMRHRFWSAVTGADIPLNVAHIDGGLILPHPNGVVIHPDARIGANVLLFQQVTIGAGGPIDGAPEIGHGVLVGAGARILGGIRIGDGARIGANAVVLEDVPDHATAVGIPARIILSESNPTRKEAA